MKYFKRRLPRAFFIVAIPVLTACSQNKLSERDLERQGNLALMEQKKQELLTVAGSFSGELVSDDEMTRDVKLKLDVKEIPESGDEDNVENNNGSVDPILVPTLVGNLRFILGTDHEYEDAPVSKADYNVQSETLYLVVRYKSSDLIIQGKYQNGTLSGAWTFPAFGVSGNVELKKEGT